MWRPEHRCPDLRLTEHTTLKNTQERNDVCQVRKIYLPERHGRDAIEALRERGMPPKILIGHSPGGAAVLYLAGEIEEVALVATIGAPGEPAHVAHLIDGNLTAEQRTRLLEIADMCPVHRTLTNQKQILTEEDTAV